MSKTKKKLKFEYGKKYKEWIKQPSKRSYTITRQGAFDFGWNSVWNKSISF